MRTPLAIGVLLGILFPQSAGGQKFPSLPDEQLAGTGVVVDCPVEGVRGTLRCGRYRVFEDREAGAGRTVDLAFVILEALEGRGEGQDVVVLLPGGPGQAFTGAAAGFAGRLEEIRRTRDILLVDVRGVGRSQSLDCPEFEIAVDDRFGTVFPPDHIAACRETLASRARLDLYTTNLSVDDLEELRTYLGYGSVNLMGTSYGSRVAQVYMRRYPGAVRTVVLNSVVPVSHPTYVHMATSLQRSLDLVVSGCDSDSSCRAAHPDLRPALNRVLDRLTAAPVSVDIGGELISFSKGDLAYALRGLLYGRADEVPPMIQRADQGDFGPLASYYLQRTAWVGGPGGEAGYHFSALCAEDIQPLTDAQVERLSEGTFMGDHLIEGYRSVCGSWDVAALPDDFWSPVRSDLPVVVISGERDPVTPPEWGESVREFLPNSVHVVVPGGGHGPANACTRRLISELLETASVAGLDATCGEPRVGLGSTGKRQPRPGFR